MWLFTHFFTIPLGYISIALLTMLSRRLSPHWRRRAQRALFLAIVISEVIKQITGIRSGEYNYSYFPFHYSSTYYICIGLYAFGRGRIRHYGACSLFVGGILMLLILTVNPLSVVGDTAHLFDSWFHVHGYFYHMIILLFFAVMLANHGYRVLPLDELRYLSFLLLWALIAVPVARATQVNFAGLLASWIPALESLRLAAGDTVYLIVYGACVFVITCIAIRILALLQKKQITRKAKMAQIPTL